MSVEYRVGDVFDRMAELAGLDWQDRASGPDYSAHHHENQAMIISHDNREPS